jgi:pSer/pThr/pTyr-binding forkhead associated (FHA) protein
MTEDPRTEALSITVATGPEAGRVFTLHGGTLVIGRDPECACALPNDTTISRRHASVSRAGSAWVLEDLGSKNGTFVRRLDGLERVTAPTRLKAGMVMVIGSAELSVDRAAEAAPRVERLRVTLQEGKLRYQFLTEDSVVSQAAHPYDEAALQEARRAIVHLVAESHATGIAPGRTVWDKAADRFSGCLMPDSIRDALMAQGEAPLTLVLDPGLIGLPWEIVPLAGAPLSLARPVARQVVLENAPPVRNAGRGHHLLMVANPTGDLKAAQGGAETLLDILVNDYGLDDLQFLGGNRARVRAVREAMEEARAVYYLGHATHAAADPGESAWALADGPLTARAWESLQQVPELVIANACESAAETPQVQGWEVLPGGSGLALSLLMAGVKQYVGALWPIPAVSGSIAGAVLLPELLDGQAIGQALHRARQTLVEAEPDAVHSATAYSLYGNPLWRFAP